MINNIDKVLYRHATKFSFAAATSTLKITITSSFLM